MPPLVETISTAVTPVVLVSAAAVLILGIGNKHQNMSDRVRSLASEARSPNTSSNRRAAISRQVRMLRRRIHYVSMSHRVLYLSIVLFLAMALLLLFAPSAVGGGVSLLICGVGMLLTAVIFEILELELAQRTLDVETADVTDVQA